MGIGELFGVKQIKLNLKEKYTIEELYDKIKDIQFEAGIPSLVKNGFAKIIAFPQIDRNNQVQILGNNGKFYVTRAVQPAGVDKLIKNMVLEELSDGWTGMSAAFGNKKKLCMALVEKTADRINEIGI